MNAICVVEYAFINKGLAVICFQHKNDIYSIIVMVGAILFIILISQKVEWLVDYKIDFHFNVCDWNLIFVLELFRFSIHVDILVVAYNLPISVEDEVKYDFSDHWAVLVFFSLRVRGQHTKTTGRRGRTVGVAKKK